MRPCLVIIAQVSPQIKLFNDRIGTDFGRFRINQDRRRERERERKSEKEGGGMRGRRERDYRKPLKSDKLSPVEESLGFSMLILKNLTESSSVLYERFIGSPFSLSPSLLSS